MKIFQFKIVGQDGAIYPIKEKGLTEKRAWKKAIHKVKKFEKRGA